jgi:GT2 family glycosyltransferase
VLIESQRERAASETVPSGRLHASVVVPTWRRTEDLARCLTGLAAQSRPPDEVVVAARPDDEQTWSLLEDPPEAARGPQLRGVPVEVAGGAPAVSAGLAAARGEIVAVTDDDAVPRPDWLAGIVERLEADPGLGGVGGRDWIHRGGEVWEGARTEVGVVRWYGRVVGNHHLGVGGARDVHVLKGVNMGWRREAVRGLRFDEGIRGSGTHMHWEIALCLAVRRAGWRLQYDPALEVDHYWAPRYGDQRSADSLRTLASEVHNETYAVLRWLPWPHKLMVLLYGLVVGTRHAPGPVTALERRLHGQRVWRALAVAQRARLGALAAASRRGRHR